VRILHVCTERVKGRRWVDANKKVAECSHRDMNLTRGYDMERKSIAAKQKYVDEPFGASQLYLELLCTHPEYQLHGAGTRLVKRGLEIGEKERVNVTLAALPTSEGFYAHLGFESVTNLSISSVDEDEWFRYDVMVYDFTDTAVE
jgi:GNAT superfamily N-acetyltransferase